MLDGRECQLEPAKLHCLRILEVPFCQLLLAFELLMSLSQRGTRLLRRLVVLKEVIPISLLLKPKLLVGFVLHVQKLSPSLPSGWSSP